MAKIIRFSAANSEYAKPLAETLREVAKAEALSENVIPYVEEATPGSLRARNLWRNKYQGLRIDVNPYAFDSEDDYLACCDALAEVMFEFDQL